MKNMLLSLFILFSINLHAGVCDQFFLGRESTESVALFDDVTTQLRNFEEYRILDDERNLNMNSYFKFDEVLESIESKLKQIEKLHPNTFEREMAFFVEKNEALFKNIDELVKTVDKRKFKPNEYEILMDLNLRMNSIQSHLNIMKLKFRYKLPKINPRTAKLKSATDNFIAEQEQLSTKLFPTTGHKNYSSLKKQLNSLSDDADAVKMIRDEDIEVVMFRPSNGRWWIEKIGFKNQHVTGSSKGYTGKLGRNAVEASLSGKTLKKFSAFDDDLKPKYAMMTGGFNKKLGFDPPHYGDDIYVFSKKRIKNKTTMTIGDSLNPISRNKGHSWSSGEVFAPNHWNEIFIPWKHREMITPALKNQIKNDRFMINYSGMDDAGMNMKWDRGNEYLETQIWGEIDLASVERFVFTREAPTKSYYEILKKHKIKVYDGRGSRMSVEGFGGLKEWKPDFAGDL